MMMKNAKWLDIVTEEVDEESRPEFDYNTPLPFTATQEEGEPEGSQESESDYLSYVAEYQNYMANSANLLAGKEKSDQLAEEAAAEGSSTGEVPGTEQGGSGQSGQLWDEYMTKYQAWYNQYGAASAGGSAGSSTSGSASPPPGSPHSFLVHCKLQCRRETILAKTPLNRPAPGCGEKSREGERKGGGISPVPELRYQEGQRVIHVLDYR